MVMPKCPPGKKRSIPVFVLLRPSEIETLDNIRTERGDGDYVSRASVLRDAFFEKYDLISQPEN